MRLKTWIKETELKMTSNDFATVSVLRGYYRPSIASRTRRPDYGRWSIIEIKHLIEKFPLLAECDIVEAREYETEGLAVGLDYRTKSFRCKHYVCQLDSDQFKIATAK